MMIGMLGSIEILPDFHNILNVIFSSLITLSVFMGGAFFNDWRTKRRKSKAEKDEQLKKLDEVDCTECEFETLTEEWKRTIDMQMHFNDLIIKFRSIVLSVFLGGLGFIFGISKHLKLDDTSLGYLIGLALLFYMACFLLDYYYYHRLLIGAVAHAAKFDENPELRKRGLFGLTKRISLMVDGTATKWLIILFYWLPIVGVISLLGLKLFSD